MAVSPGAPTLVYAPHPLLAAGRQHFSEPFATGETLETYLARLGLPLHAPLVITHNDCLVDRADWSTTMPAPGDLIVVRAAVQGGGDGSKILRTVLTIAVLYAAGPVAGSMGLQTFGTAVAKGVIAVGGMLAVNAILPRPTPNLREAQEAGSPTYTLAGGSNRLRPYAPLPLILGRHIIYPDLGAKEYSEFRGGDQYLHQVFNYGLSDVTLSERRIGTTSIAAFDEVDIETSGDDGAISLFPTNVDSIAGAEFIEAEAWIQRTSSVNATALAIDITGLLFSIQFNGETVGTIVIFEAEYRGVGTSTWQAFPEEPHPNFIFTPSRFYVISSGREPIRFSLRRSVPVGQYEVRVRILPTYPDQLGINNLGKSIDLAWSQLRTYQADDADYSGQQREALAIRATSQLSGTVDAYNAIAEARCEVWNGSAWVTQHTRNPAWWFRWFARGKTDANERIIFGGGLSDARLELDTLIDWASFCDANDLTVDMVIDRPMNCDEVLDAIARCGRGAKTWGSGKLGVIWDAPDQPVVAVFGMGNIVRSSFEIDYATGQLPDEVIGNFINPDLDWQQDTVRASAPGVTNPSRPLTIDLFGITDADQAGRAVLLQAAEQVYRRRRTIWETDEEGLIASRGDVVTVSHDLTNWGYSGRLRAGTTTELTLDRAVPFEDGEDHYIGVRAPDGSYDVYEVEYQAGEGRVITLLDALPAAPDDDPDHSPWDYTWVFEPTTTPGRRLKIISIEPLNNRRYRFTAVDDVPEYYAAEDNPFTWTPQTPNPGQYPTVTNLSITDTLIRIGSGFGVRMRLVWDVSGDYGGAWIRYRIDDEPWILMGSTADRRASFEVADNPGAEVEIEIHGYNHQGRTGDNSKVTSTHVLIGTQAPPPPPLLFLISRDTDGGRRLTWDDPNPRPVDLAGYLIRYAIGTGAEWDDMRRLHQGVLTASPYETNQLSAGTYTFAIRSIDTSENVSTPVYIEATLGNPRLGSALNVQQSHVDGWPGTITNGHIDPLTGWLLATDTKTWDDLATDELTWDDWTQWNRAPATLTYVSETIDIGLITQFTPLLSAEFEGTATLEVDISDDNVTWAGWAVPAGRVTARYVRARSIVEPIGTEQNLLRAMTLILDAEVITEVIDDIDMSALTGAFRIGTGDIRIPINQSYGLIRMVEVTLQNVGPGWSWELVDKSADPGPRIRIYNASDNLADAIIDVTVRGV